MIADVIQVDVRTWLRSLPQEVVTPQRADAAAAEVLAGVPLPPGYSDGFPARLGVNERYRFAAQLTGLAGCRWVQEWQRAKAAGDQAAVIRAADALCSSHNWQVLKDIQEEGLWSRNFWETADRTAAGSPPEHWTDMLGCAQF